MAMDSFAGKLAVVTGGGSGMGRELVRQLAAQGCSVAACDVNADAVAVTAATAWAAAPPGVAVTGHACDVSDEAQVLRFRDELLEQHASDHVDLVFSNAGIGGGGSFVNDSRQEWERTFAVGLVGRVLLRPRVLAAADRQRRGRPGQHQQLERLVGLARPGDAEQRLQHGEVRGARIHRGAHRGPAHQRAAGPGRGRAAGVTSAPTSSPTPCAPTAWPTRKTMSDAKPRRPGTSWSRPSWIAQDASRQECARPSPAGQRTVKDKAPLSAAEAATIILDGVRAGAWRILVGKDAAFVDERVRGRPESRLRLRRVVQRPARRLPAGRERLAGRG